MFQTHLHLFILIRHRAAETYKGDSLRDYYHLIKILYDFIREFPTRSPRGAPHFLSRSFTVELLYSTLAARVSIATINLASEIVNTSSTISNSQNSHHEIFSKISTLLLNTAHAYLLLLQHTHLHISTLQPKLLRRVNDLGGGSKGLEGYAAPCLCDESQHDISGGCSLSIPMLGPRGV